MRRNLAVLFGCLGLVSCVLTGCGGSGTDSGKGGVSYPKMIAEALKESEPEVKASKLIDIGVQQAKAMAVREAEDTLEMAFRACGEIKDPRTRAERFSRLAERQAQAPIGNTSAARRSLKGAREAADAIEDAEPKAKALVGVARGQGAAKDLEGAVETLKAAEKIAGELPDAMGKTMVLGPIAAAYGRIGQEAESDRVLQAALAAAQGADNAQTRTNAMAEVAAVQSQMKKKADAEKTFNLTLESARKIEQPYGQCQAMIEIAVKLSKAGFAAKAHQLLKDAEAITPKIPEVDLQQQTLEKIRGTMDKLPKP
jgi:tetratricopeptide (TPR) repeat protein